MTARYFIVLDIDGVGEGTELGDVATWIESGLARVRPEWSTDATVYDDLLVLIEDEDVPDHYGPMP